MAHTQTHIHTHTHTILGCQPITQQQKTQKEAQISCLCHCVFGYSSLRSRRLLRSECCAALMGWFGIQLDAGSYFGMPDKVFWWRTIAAASGDSLMVYGWEHTPCLWLHKTMHYVPPPSPYHTISRRTTRHTGQRRTTSGSTALCMKEHSLARPFFNIWDKN